MTVFGMLRVKNEARWIGDVIQSILPLCERVWVLDDHSTDGTPELCDQLGDQVTVMRSPFLDLNESRDRDFLLGQVMECVPGTNTAGDEQSPFWALAIDGDELLDTGGPDAIRWALLRTSRHAFKLPVRYLWDSKLSEFSQRRRIRVDGVYKHFARPSVFRLFDRNFRFQTTTCSANLHCSSIPKELLPGAGMELAGAPLWHFGYNDRADRLRKYDWYNQIDPGNMHEDQYRHIVQGDIPEVPVSLRLMHAGPLELEILEVNQCSAA